MQVLWNSVFEKMSQLPERAAFCCISAKNMLLYKLKVCVPSVSIGKNTFCAALLEKYKKEGEAMVELDQFKSILATYTEPLVEVRDSL